MAKQEMHRLRPEVAEKYRATITPTRIEIQRLGRTIDLRTLTLEEADVLVQDPKFTYLVAKRKRWAPAAQKTTEE
ncbi:hypothetical protein J0X19_22120 [Hymenobacter sp. BT186]|uniref:Uncharacterized protein n=1 Tax=Hymenobacter telluris TaxID=2816474 RepID=A0A939JF61_9BACT|nr:hypothetical protein [Hymenobacter telluris]MBO0360673.1 hypothetical protein [Hymenobacter telluris]MBW3376700.1 hypothetical protein [Hymenobacter norwichensis]